MREKLISVLEGDDEVDFLWTVTSVDMDDDTAERLYTIKYVGLGKGCTFS